MNWNFYVVEAVVQNYCCLWFTVVSFYSIFHTYKYNIVHLCGVAMHTLGDLPINGMKGELASCQQKLFITKLTKFQAFEQTFPFFLQLDYIDMHIMQRSFN